jgi:hypothetical protein
MATESGFSSQKKYGEAQHKTIHNLGSDRWGTAVTPKGLFEVNGTIARAITNVLVSEDRKTVYLDFASAHNARVGDVLRITSGALIGYEFEIKTIPDADSIGVENIGPTVLAIGDNTKVMRWVTSKTDAEGNVNFSPGPTTYVRDGLTTTVTKDTVTPANTRAMPVEIVAADGMVVNVETGDINVKIRHDGANPDSVRIGDGVDLLAINADGSLNVVTTGGAGLATETTLSALNDKQTSFDLDTGAGTQNVQGVSLRKSAAGGSVELGTATDPVRVDPTGTTTQPVSAASLPLPSGAATEATLSTLNGKLGSLGQKTMAGSAPVTIASDQSAIPVTGTFWQTTQPVSAASLPLPTGASTLAEQQTQSTRLGDVLEIAPATDTASSGINGRLQRIAQRLSSLITLLPSSIGRKAMADSLSVTLASDQPNLSVAQTALTASFVEDTTLSTTVKTIAAPVGAKWAKIMNVGDNNIRLKLGGAVASSTSGMRVEPGRSEDFRAVGDISICTEVGAGSVAIQWGV